MARASLVIMAAGIGSRFGGGIKQLESVGPSGEIIMDYSIYDAIEAGFDRIVFIIRKDLDKDFREIIGNRIAQKIEVAYAYQELDKIPEGYADKLEGRTKPWGTGQAVLMCKGIVNEPFAVINADDYYGKEAFKRVYDYLVNDPDHHEGYKEDGVYKFCTAGYILKNTLSENGSVTRGVIGVDENSYLKSVTETYNIVKTPGGAGVRNEDGTVAVIDADSHVSMNMWGLYPEFLDVLDNNFGSFLNKIPTDNKKKEYLLPVIIGDMVTAGRADVQMLETKDKWFGVTYKEDKDSVKASIQALVEAGEYPNKL